MGIQAAGRAGGAQLIGDALFRNEAAAGAAKRTYMEDFEAKRWENEESAMFAVRTGRLQTQAKAWGGPAIGGRGGLISGLVGSLNEDPQVMQQAIAQAFKIGGTEGIKNIDQDNITKLVREGYGSAAEVMAAQAVAGRYGYGMGATTDLANRTGLTMDQVLPMMQQTRMQYYMFKQGTTESINKFVGNTDIGAMNPSMGLSMVAQTAQGASNVGDEASSMLQYREFVDANPGSTYLDFVEAKRNGFADERWRRFVGGAAAKFGAGGQMMRIAGGKILGTAPGTLQEIGKTYAQGMGPDVTRTGIRTQSETERYAQVFGGVSREALTTNMDFIGKYVLQFGSDMATWSAEMKAVVASSSDYVDGIIKVRQKLKNDVADASYGFIDKALGMDRPDGMSHAP
jgi:hypothetical protein